MTAQNTPPLIVPSQADIDKTFPGGTRRIWEKSHSLTLYSIRPARELPFSDQAEKVDSLDNEYTILGKVVVRDATQLKELRCAVDDIYASRPGFYTNAACFNPHHAVRAQWDGKTVDLVVCFECGTGYVYRNGENVGSISMYSKQAAATFNRLLEEHGVPLPD